MPKTGKPIFIQDFLIPSLDAETFGERLKWWDKEKKIFDLFWTHRSGPKWTEKDIEVFVSWDKLKGHFKSPITHLYLTECKQRFRAVLLKLCKETVLEEINTKIKGIKRYRIVSVNKHKRERKLSSGPKSPQIMFINIIKNIDDDLVTTSSSPRNELAMEGNEGMQTEGMLQETPAQTYEYEQQSLYSPKGENDVKNMNYNNQDVSEILNEYDIDGPSAMFSNLDPYLPRSDLQDDDDFSVEEILRMIT